jgi:hypothetical protein
VFDCEDAIGNGILVTLTPGTFSTQEVIGPGFRTTVAGDCRGTIAVGQHLTCTITNTQRPTTGTLLVRKLCVTLRGSGCDPNFHFPIEVTRNNNPQPQPSTFVLTPDSSQHVTLAPGSYTITEGQPPGVSIAATFSGKCIQSGSLSATGTIVQEKIRHAQLITSDSNHHVFQKILHVFHYDYQDKCKQTKTLPIFYISEKT